MSVIWVGRERLCFLLLGAVEASGGKKVDLALYWRGQFFKYIQMIFLCEDLGCFTSKKTFTGK